MILSRTDRDDTLFNDFSFHDQLERKGFSGTDVTWTDSLGTSGTVSFASLAGPDADFARIGIVVLDGETLKSVSIMTPGAETLKRSEVYDVLAAGGGC